MKHVLPLIFGLCPALAMACPAAPDHRAEIDTVLDALALSAGPAEARPLTEQLWSLWTDAPDDRAQAMLDNGMALRAQNDFAAAWQVLDDLVAYCPDYAEGYNQRAFASFLARDFVAALADLDRTLELMPNHVAAMSGRGLTLIGLGREDEAQAALRAAIAMNPWLNERSLLKEPPGQSL